MEVSLSPPNTSWEKIHQGLIYVDMMRNLERFGATKADGDLKQVSFDRPMLLSSIIMGKNGAHGEFGLFLCVPVAPLNGAEHGEFRVMLLWRKRVDNNQNEVSAAFGKVFQASIALQIWRKEMDWCDFEYLGPSCARVGDRVIAFWLFSLLHSASGSSGFELHCVIYIVALPIVRHPL